MSPFVRRALRLCGMVCLAGSASLLAAAAVPAGVLSAPGRLLAAIEGPAPQPSPSPAPRRRRFLGEGPIVVSGRGGVDLGVHRSVSNAAAQSSAQYGGNVTLALARRTERAFFEIDQGLGYNAGSGSIGQLQLGYRTPDYAAEYGAIAGPAQSQLAIGGFVRGIRLSRPTLTGSLELLAAATSGAGGTGFTAVGLRSVRSSARGQLSLTALQERAQHGDGRNSILAAAYEQYGMRGTSVVEAALAMPRSIPGLDDGPHLALALTTSRNTQRGFAQLRVVDIPRGFATLNGITMPSLDVALALRQEVGRVSLGLTQEHQRLSQGAVPDVTDRTTAQLSRGFGSATLSLTGSATFEHGFQSAATTRSFGATLSHTLGHSMALSETYQFAVGNGTGGATAQRNVGIALSRQLGRGFVEFAVAGGSAIDPLTASRYQQETLGYTRPIGAKLDFTSTLGTVRTVVNGSPTVADTAGIGLIRHLSRVMSLRVAATSNVTRGATVTRGTTLDVNLIGPIAFGGNSVSRGSGDARSPGVVRGHVFVAGNSDLSVAASQQRGYGNVLVVLDNTQTQRTDATGEYEFRFVKPGRHTVGIEPASLPAGFIADRLNESIPVNGGQVTSVDFGVGRFAGVGGRVLYGGGDGVAGVVLIVDGTQRVTTDRQGRWELGRLTPGTHRVAVSLQGLPSSVIFSGATEKVVQVVNGSVTPVDFVALRLGSVAGAVMISDPNDPSSLRGAKDVYVVAQPGDHAAITDDTGSFLLDNLPPGTYALSLDKETVPDGMSAGEPQNVVVAAGEHVGNVTITLGQDDKSVVFTFKGGKRSALVLTADPSSVPPGAVVRVSVRGDNLTGPVRLESDVFAPIALARDKVGGAWVGSFIVPGSAHGELSLQAIAPSGTASNAVTVDSALALVSVRTLPLHPQPGRPVHLTIKTYAPVAAGDELVFDDGQKLKLPAAHGRSYELDLRMAGHPLPFNGEIVTRRGGRYAFAIK